MRSIAIIREDSSICDDSGIYKKDCLESLGEDIPVDIMIESCMAYGEVTEQNICLRELARSAKTEQPCGLIEGEYHKFLCYGNVAGVKDNFDLCQYYMEILGYVGSNYKEALCILGYTEIIPDVEKCQIIENSENVKVGYVKEVCVKSTFQYPQASQ